MKPVAVLFSILAFLTIISPNVLAYSYCTNTTWSLEVTTHVIAGSDIQQEKYNFCGVAGCNSATGMCHRAEWNTGVTIETVGLLLLLGFAFFAWGVKRKAFIQPLIAMIFFLTASFAAYSVEYVTNRGVISYGPNMPLIYIGMIFTAISLIMMLVFLFRGMGSDDEGQGMM